MSFNKALLVAAILTLIVGFFKIQISKNDTVDNNASEETEVLYSKADFKLFNSEPKKRTPRKITVPFQGGKQIINVNEILYCVAENDRVLIHTKTTYNEPIITTTKFSLSKMKSKIGSAEFMYDNLRKYIINFNSIDKILHIQSQMNQKRYTYEIIMENDDNLVLPVGKKEEFMKDLNNYIETY